MADYSITCHCGNVAQTVTLNSTLSELQLCHCSSCRHSTGLLCVSYEHIDGTPSTDRLSTFKSPHTPDFTRYFCQKCGCHVFWESIKSGSSVWAVATGTLIGQAEETQLESQANAVAETSSSAKGLRPYAAHANTYETKDGGLAPWITHVDGRELELLSPYPACLREGAASDLATAPPAAPDDFLYASCLCQNLRLRISRPDDRSRLPKSPYTDLMFPFCSTERSKVLNPDDEKWWLQPAGSPSPTKYLAGTCACRSCRLISGFEIQTWAFIPRVNIAIFPIDASGAPVEEQDPVPLDFANLPPGILSNYQSAEGVTREFCAKCGATAFWHDNNRPYLIDVSVGLFDSPQGARAEDWLEWFMGRVSFFEETGTGRTGSIRKRAEALIQGLEDGMKAASGSTA